MTEAEVEILREKASVAGLTTSDLVREALSAFLREKEKKKNKGLKRVFAKGTDECDHPWSKQMQLPGGIQCDDCGEWI